VKKEKHFYQSVREEFYWLNKKVWMKQIIQV
jgi:hypothetical protein